MDIRAKKASWMRRKLIDLHPKPSEVIRNRIVRMMRIASESSSEVIRNHPKPSEVRPANHPNPSSCVYRHRKDRMADGSDDQDRIWDLRFGCGLVEKVKND